MLENEGFHSVMACDCQTGFQQALELKPRLMLVDLVMPGLSGIEVCRQLRAKGARTPLMVLSAIAGEMDRRRLRGETAPRTGPSRPHPRRATDGTTVMTEPRS